KMKIAVETDSRVPRTAIDTNRRQRNVCEVRRCFRAAPRWVLLATLLITLQSTGYAQQVSSSANQAVDEPLAEQVNDPLAHLTQLQIKDAYTPAEYGTDAQPNPIQFRSIF